MQNQKRKIIISLLLSCLFLFLAGCSSASGNTDDRQEGQTKIGPVMEIDAPQEFTLLDNKDALAADGLYYATWVMGNPSPYENSDGDMVEIYNAQLYLLVSETKNGKSAENNYQAWLTSAKDFYHVHTEDTITCNGQSYTMITYDCTGEDTPYDRGVSAIGVHGANAICAELTCTENYQGDLASLLTEFLNGCHYSSLN